MKKTIPYLLAIFFFVSCNRSKNATLKANQIFSENVPKETLFQVSGARDTTIKTKNGTILKFKNGLFKSGNGNDYEGFINLKIIELYSPSDLVFSGVSTMSKSNLLQTGGMLYIEALDSLKAKLVVSNTEYFTVMFSKNMCPNEQMDFYVGRQDTTGNVEWSLLERHKEMKSNLTMPTDSIISEEQKLEYQQSLDYMVFKSNELGWLNCDKQLESLNNTKVKVNSNFDADVSFRLIFPALKSVACAILEDGTYTFYNVPKNEKAILVGYSKIDNRYYFTHSEVTIEENGSLEPKLVETDKKEIEEKIKKLTWIQI